MPDRTTLTHQEIQELLGAHAADAVEPDERTIIDEHLETCDACRSEVDRHHETLVLLVTPAEPPSSLRAAVLAGAQPGTAPAAPVTAPVVSMDDARHRRPSPARSTRVAAILAAAAAVVVVVGIGFAVGRRSVGSPPPADLQALVAEAQTQPGTHQVTLSSTDGSLHAQITQTADGTGYLQSDQLPALSADQTYQLWAFSGSDGKTPISLGVLGNDPTLSTFKVDAAVTAFAVSREADGGAVAPTDPIISGPV